MQTRPNPFFILLSLLALFACPTLWAQKDENPAPPAEFRQHLPEVTPIPKGRINCLAVDKHNTKWIGTENGFVAFYADSTWRTFENPNTFDTLIHKVSSIAIAPNGNIWLGSYSNDIVSVVQLDSYGEYVSHVEIPTFSNRNFYIKAVSVDKQGGVWVATQEGGLWQIAKNGKKTLYDQKFDENIYTDEFNAVYAAPNGEIWVGTSKGMFTIQNGKMKDTYDVVSGYGEDNIISIEADEKGNVCVTAVDRKGKQYFACNQQMYRMAKRITRASDFRFNDVLVLASGDIWVAGKGMALSRGGEWFFYDENNSDLKAKSATAVAIDSDSTLWIGTAVEGLFQMKFKKEEPILAQNNEEDPKKEEVFVLEEKVETTEIEVKPLETFAPEVKTVKMKETVMAKGSTVTLNEISFQTKSYALLQTAGLDDLAVFLKENPKVRIELSGHTDRDLPRSHPQYEKVRQLQLELSQKRVQTVVDYLVGKGIAPERIVSKAYGGSKPLVAGNSEKNRRVEMKILEVE
ncbi:OmpA family protein [Hugenholtzia roseola]|uniref:OmpA family protein n=1 Tax=Hugenholtzia roseola TaxID=1002 RepID=UPI0012B583A5|nr:OmpA family protein [Hugenholtzia roseola]